MINEDALEKAALGWFAELGYECSRRSIWTAVPENMWTAA